MDEEANSKLPMTFSARYKMGDILGKGAFSTVRLATSKISNKKWAVKAVARKGLPQDDEDALRSEVAILRKLPYRHIVYCKVRNMEKSVTGCGVLGAGWLSGWVAQYSTCF